MVVFIVLGVKLSSCVLLGSVLWMVVVMVVVLDLIGRLFIVLLMLFNVELGLRKKFLVRWKWVIWLFLILRLMMMSFLFGILYFLCMFLV